MEQTKWNLWLNRHYQAAPWPWNSADVADIEAGALPWATTDFLAYSPTDGAIDRVNVTPGLPRPLPACRTELAIYHQPEAIIICMLLHRPDKPIPELASTPREDISCVLPGPGGFHGLYLGMDQDGKHIAIHQVWDGDQLAAAEVPKGLAKGCAAGVRPWLEGQALAWFRVPRTLVPEETFALSAGRHCYATGELLAWGAPIVWSPPPEGHGQVSLVEQVEAPDRPTLRRVDLTYDYAALRGSLALAWEGAESVDRWRDGQYGKFVDQVGIAVNGSELAQALEAGPLEIELRQGWNRLEVLTAFSAPRVIELQAMPSDRLIACDAEPVPEPSAESMRRDFTAWHEGQERLRRAPGLWASPDKARCCLCHDGVFKAEPYLLAVTCLDDQPIYRERVRETAERMLEEQHADGWYPCYCSALDPTAVPKKGDGGAFTQGSVGEFCVRAASLLDEPRYWESAVRGADYSWYAAEINQNYAAFAAWHLGALYEQEPRAEWLDRAIYYIDHFAARDIGLSGAQGGHNFFTGYGNITLRGMASLLEVLPADHPAYAGLRATALRYTNQLLSRRQPDGVFAGRNRRYIGYRHALPGLFRLAQALPELRDTLRPVLLSMYDPTNGTLIARTAEFLGHRG